MAEFNDYLLSLLTEWSGTRIFISCIAVLSVFFFTALPIAESEKPFTNAGIVACFLALVLVVWPVAVGGLIVLFATWWVGKIREENRK